MARAKVTKKIKKRTTKTAGDSEPTDTVTSQQAPPGQEKQAKRTAALRWTEELVEGGFTPISNFFLEFGHELRPIITHGEAMFIVHLMFFKWDEKMPRPGFKTIATRMGISHGRVRELARQLERKKYLKRHMEKSKPNRFDLRPLFSALEKLRREKVAERKAAEARRKPRPI